MGGPRRLSTERSRFSMQRSASSHAVATATGSERLDFVNRANADYIERLYEQYQRDPRSLDEYWQAYFAGFETAGGRGFVPSTGAEGEKPRALTLGVHNLVHSYRELGHFVSKLDPLGHDRPTHPLLDLSQFNITPQDLDF